MSLKIMNGNIFDSNCDVLVNTTNCIGPMGAGIAKQFREKDYQLYLKYKHLCESGSISPGILWIYNSLPIGKRVLCFPTKKHWKDASKLEYILLGLDKFVNTYESKKIDSIAFPVLGCGLGGLDKNIVVPIMKEYFSKTDIYIEIYGA